MKTYKAVIPTDCDGICTLKQDDYDLYTQYSCFIWNNSDIEENAKNNDVVENSDDLDSKDTTTEEENNMKDNILNLWKTQEIQKIKSQFDKQKKTIMEKDELYKITAEYIDKAKQIIEDEDFNYDLRHMTECIESHLDRDVQKEIEILNDKFSSMTKDVNKLVEEVKAQLEMAETYDQKINILKAYDILDFNGKIKKESDTASDTASNIEIANVKRKNFKV